MLDDVELRVGRPGPAILYYTGCCVSGSPGTRATDGFKVSGTMFTSLAKHWKVKNVKVFRMNLPPVPIDMYEYRAARYLQLEERSLIALRYPLGLNSVPGGLRHEYAWTTTALVLCLDFISIAFLRPSPTPSAGTYSVWSRCSLYSRTRADR